MKKHLLLLFFITTVSVEAQITFQKTFGGANADSGNSVRQTTDGGYIICGRTNSFGAGSYDVYLIKTDSLGDILWAKKFGGTNDDFGNSVQQTTDGGYVVVGNTASFGFGFDDIYLIKTDANGDTIWTETFGGADYDEGYFVQQTTDGGYIVAGITASYGAGDNDVYLIKLDANGDSLWTKTFGGTNDDAGYSVYQTTDGGYIITGKTKSFGAGNNDVYLIKTDVNGNFVWTKTFGGTDEDVSYSVQQTTDGGYIISGYTAGFGAIFFDAYLIKSDANGDSLWTKTFGGSDHDDGYFVHQTTDGGYIIAGYTSSFGAGIYDVYLIKTDVNGDSLWTKIFGKTDYDEGYCVHQTTDGGYIITGEIRSFGAGNRDIYLIKTDANGNSGCNEGSTATIVGSPATQVTNPATIVTSPNTIVTNPPTIVGGGGIDSTLCSSVDINEITIEKSFVIFPNPANSQCTIHNLQFTIEKVEIVNLIGEKMTNSVSFYCGQFAQANPSLSGWTIDCRLLSPGIYFVNVISEKGNETQKLVVQH